MIELTARDMLPSTAQDDHEPMSLVRVRSKPVRRFDVRPHGEAFRSTLFDPTTSASRGNATLPEDLDSVLGAGFADAIVESGANVGLLHRRGDAFFYTIDVHGLERGMHMHVWLSMWDAAVEAMLRGRTFAGASQLTAEHATVARRLGGTADPTSIVAVPVTVGQSVEAIVELGRYGEGFARGADLLVLEAMQELVGRAA